MNKKQKKALIQIIVASCLMIVFSLLPVKGIFRFVLFMIPYLTVGYDVLRKALKGIKNKQIFDENFLMAVATLGAIILGEYTEGVAVMLFYQIGELFQSYAVGKSRKNISELMDIRPDYANIYQDGQIVKVDPDEVEIGSIIVVKPGEKIPIDGIICEGNTTLNTAALTGESIPRDVECGDEVISGCVNLNGLIQIKTTKEFGESTVSKILDMVENASSKKSRSEEFIAKFAKYYTPIVCYLALAMAVIPTIVNFIIGREPNALAHIYSALTFLVISCPCALVISIPLTFFAAIGGASNAGVLIKGSNYLETLSKVGIVVFDKTGTMTKGEFKVSGVHHTDLAGFSDDEVLYYAAHIESFSSHPISESLKKYYIEQTGLQIDTSLVSDVEEKAGYGVKGIIDKHTVVAGNDKYMKLLAVDSIACSSIGTVVHVAIDGKYAGHILISDDLKPTAKESIVKLNQVGVRETVMLTGDRASAANAVGNELKISSVYSELLPGDKVSKVEELLAKCDSNSTLAFVGDGINDAPVLSRADVGIAMGAMGSDAAIEAADVVLMDDDPAKIAKAIRIAKKCMGIVYENIYFAIGVKVLCLILGALGIANMWMAIFADVGVMVIAVLNAIRVMFVKKL